MEERDETGKNVRQREGERDGKDTRRNKTQGDGEVSRVCWRNQERTTVGSGAGRRMDVGKKERKKEGKKESQRRKEEEGKAKNHLSVPTRFYVSRPTLGETMETESILRTDGHRCSADWHRSDRRISRSRSAARRAIARPRESRPQPFFRFSSSKEAAYVGPRSRPICGLSSSVSLSPRTSSSVRLLKDLVPNIAQDRANGRNRSNAENTCTVLCFTVSRKKRKLAKVMNGCIK